MSLDAESTWAGTEPVTTRSRQHPIRWSRTASSVRLVLSVSVSSGSGLRDAYATDGAAGVVGGSAVMWWWWWWWLVRCVCEEARRQSHSFPQISRLVPTLTSQSSPAQVPTAAQRGSLCVGSHRGWANALQGGKSPKRWHEPIHKIEIGRFITVWGLLLTELVFAQGQWADDCMRSRRLIPSNLRPIGPATSTQQRQPQAQDDVPLGIGY